MPTLAETQLRELTAWLVASSQDERTPLGNDFIRHDAYAAVIPPFLMGSNRRIQAAVFSFMAGVMPPIPMLGRSLL